MKARLTGLARGMDGGYLLTISTPDKAVEGIWDALRETDVAVEVKKWRRKRSMDANAYFHLLVGKIAEKLSETDKEPPTNDDVKRRLVLDYGAIDTDTDGHIVGAKIPAGVDIIKYYPYAKVYKEVQENGRTYECYVFYKRTRDLDSKEMARLIDGTIKEAKQLDIDTAKPWELEAMKNAWTPGRRPDRAEVRESDCLGASTE